MGGPEGHMNIRILQIMVSPESYCRILTFSRSFGPPYICMYKHIYTYIQCVCVCVHIYIYMLPNVKFAITTPPPKIDLNAKSADSPKGGGVNKAPPPPSLFSFSVSSC